MSLIERVIVIVLFAVVISLAIACNDSSQWLLRAGDVDRVGDIVSPDRQPGVA